MLYKTICIEYSHQKGLAFHITVGRPERQSHRQVCLDGVIESRNYGEGAGVIGSFFRNKPESLHNCTVRLRESAELTPLFHLHHYLHKVKLPLGKTAQPFVRAVDDIVGQPRGHLGLPQTGLQLTTEHISKMTELNLCSRH